jgi:cytochrome c biogenesis protein CcdA
MLGSITPLGERGRRSRWGLTLSAYVVGSLIGGAVFGAIVGAAGSAIGVAAWSVGVRLSIVAAALAVGLVADLQIGGVRLPTVHRQVDEEWRTRYRGWVWGSAFGLQLGVGVVTVVTTSTVYVTWLAAGLSGGARGAAVGATFGLARALPVFAVARVRAPAQLLRVDGALRRLASPARRLTYVAGGALAAVALMGAAR